MKQIDEVILNGSCFPRFTAADIFLSVKSGEPITFSTPLLSENMNGTFESMTSIHIDIDSKGFLSALVRFDYNGVALPYNIFAILLLIGAGVYKWIDVTREFRSPAAGLFPGDVRTVCKGQLKPGDFHVVVWGR